MNKTYEKNIYFENDFTVDLEHLKKMMKYPCLPYIKALEVLNIIAVCVSALYIVASLLCAVFRISSGFDAMFFLPVVVLILKTRQFPGAKARAGYAALGNRDLMYHYVFDDNMIVMYSNDGKTDAYAYSVINDLREDADAFVLRIRETGVIRVPKNSFTYGDPAYFSDFIRSRTAGNKASNAPMITDIIFTSISIALITVSLLLLLESVLFRTPDLSLLPGITSSILR